MSLKERAKHVLVGVLIFCLIFTSTPSIALSALTIHPTNAYAQNTEDSTHNGTEPSPARETNPTNSESAPLNSEGTNSSSATAPSNEGGSSTPSSPDEPASGTEATDRDSSSPLPSEDTSESGPLNSNNAPSTDNDSTSGAPDAGEGNEEVPVRQAREFNANNYIKNFKFSIESGDITKSYDLSNGEHIDINKDFPNGLSRSATYVGIITLDVKALAEATNEYPLVPGDTLTCDFPDILRPNNTMTGRLRDASADWDSQHDGVGNYTIENGKLTLTYDDGYLVEKSGKILTSSIKFSGTFDTSSKPEDAFDFALTFGSITIGSRFSKLEIVRNLSIEKTGTTITTNQGRFGSAEIDSEDNLTYTLNVSASEDNTHMLTHVKVVDVFDEESQNKVDLSSMKLVKASIDGEDITERCVALTDDQNRINGWDIGNLPAGTSASVTFKIKINKEGISAAVKAAKEATPDTDAAEARTIKNTASASADSVPAVTDDYSTTVKNTISLSKSNESYDYQTQTKNFIITVRTPDDNRYTEYNVPIRDVLSSVNNTLGFDGCGITAMSVRHSDGSSENITWDNFTQFGLISWGATIPEIRPGDVISIKSYAKVNESFWNTPLSSTSGSGGDGYIENTVKIGSGTTFNNLAANDLDYTQQSISFSLITNWLTKSSPAINDDGTISWSITGNQQGKLSSPKNAAGQTITDSLGPNQIFEDGTASVVFYNQDGSVAGRDSITLQQGSTSFSYTIPDQFGTCGFVITYKSKITDWDSYVGPAKKYTNSVSGLWNWSHTSSTSSRARVASMSKTFVKQADDWAQWKTTIFSELEKGDVYEDTSRNGISYMYFTQDQINAIVPTIDGVALDPSLYEITPKTSTTEDKYAGYTMTFKGSVGIQANGQWVKPSKDHPLTMEYQTTMINPPRNNTRDYYNDATLTAGTIKDSDYDYCRRANSRELSKSVRTSSNGTITWLVKANYWGYSAQPDNTCIVTDTLPAGTDFVSAVQISGRGSLEVQDVTKNDDGTTTLTLKLSDLGHDEVSKNHPTDNNGSYEFHFLVKTKITDEDYLYGTESKDFNFTNTISLTDRYGNDISETATATVHHTALQKNMTYNETTAPYAQFSIALNKEKVDLAPESDTVNIVDVSSDTLAVDPKSFEVINATTGDPIPFEIDASKMADNIITVKVPDETYVKITYNAQVLGMTGKTVLVGNSAYFEGHERTMGSNTISQTVQVLKATGQSVSEPMIWFSKRNETALALGGAQFDLYAYNNSSDNAEDASSWDLIKSGLTSTGDTASKGIKVESLKLGTLYKLVETSAPAGYVLNPNPYYFSLYGTDDEETPVPAYPANIAEHKMFQGPSGSTLAAYNQPYTTVKFAKMSDDGVQLEGAKLEVHQSDGTLATDSLGNSVLMTTKASEPNEFSLAPGEYSLVETEAPTGYEIGKEEHFTVLGNAERSVTEQGKPVSVVTLTNSSKKTSLTVTKQWRDADNIFLSRPNQIEVQLYKNNQPADQGHVFITSEGKDGLLGTDDDWSTTFENLNVMEQGKPVSYSVKEVNVSFGYEVSYPENTEAVSTNTEDSLALVITNTLVAPPTTIPVQKNWIDENNSHTLRPESITVHLFADGTDTGQTLKLYAEGPDGIKDTEDDWTGEFKNVNLLKDGELISYTLREDDCENYHLVENPPQEKPAENSENLEATDITETRDALNALETTNALETVDAVNAAGTLTSDNAVFIDEVSLENGGFTLTNLFVDNQTEDRPTPTPDPSSSSDTTNNNTTSLSAKDDQQDKVTPPKTSDPLFLGATIILGALGIGALALVLLVYPKKKKNL